MNRPFFKGRPIATNIALARTLQIHPKQLLWIVERVSQLYQPLSPKIKPDGSIRQIYNPAHPLKDIQKRINQHIFSRVSFPAYLQGGIRDKRNPRHCLTNAKLHAGAKIVINEDISGFFPSTSKKQIQSVWQHFFCFPPGIAAILAELTTYNGQLPQGAPTSSYLANLILWEDEPELVERLTLNDWRYSRYIDDITLSSTRFQNNASKAWGIRQIKRMCRKNSYATNQSKHRIESSGKAMHINNLLINKGVTLPKNERARVRAAVRECEKHEKSEQATDAYRKLFNRTRGRVYYLRQYHRCEGDVLLQRLEAARPLTPTK